MSKRLEANEGTIGMHCADDVFYPGIEAGSWSYPVRSIDGTGVRAVDGDRLVDAGYRYW